MADPIATRYCALHDTVKHEVDDHEIRIKKLEVNGAVIEEKLTSACDSLSSIKNWIMAIGIVGITSMLGAVGWFIVTTLQHLGVK